MFQTAGQHGIQERITAELRGLEPVIARELSSDLSCVNQLVSHVGRYRGKMVRSRLLLTAGLACEPEGRGIRDSHRVAACVVELVHQATLVHDDILDEARMRRRGQTINHLCGNEAAVMLGDYLISHAYHLCSGLERPDISRLIADVTNTVCEGELLQLTNRNNWLLDEGTYFEMIFRKTASLFGVCGRLAARLSHADDTVEEALCAYGHHLGVAYQIMDDLADLIAKEDEAGKTLGLDLDKGKLTLPLIRYMNSCDASSQNRMIEMLVLQSDPETESSVRCEQSIKIRDYLKSGEYIAYAHDKASQRIEAAKESVSGVLTSSHACGALLDLADLVMRRDF